MTICAKFFRAGDWTAWISSYVFLDVLLIVGRRVDSTVAADHDSDRRLHPRIRRHGRRNEVHDLAVLHASDADATPAARIVIRGARSIRMLLSSRPNLAADKDRIANAEA
jgi:hypothetical protein